MKGLKYVHSTASFSPCRKYRYLLSRTWDEKKPVVAFIMLNPSTADENVLDPTVRRCVGFAISLGFGSLIVGNIFALRSTDPRALYSSDDPIGRHNDIWLGRIADGSDETICAWGSHGNYLGRGESVLSRLADIGVTPRCLKQNKDGTPAHPLYLRSDLKPRAMI